MGIRSAAAKPTAPAKPKMYLWLLREAHPPATLNELVAEFLEREFLAHRSRGRPSTTWFQKAETKIRLRVINARVADGGRPCAAAAGRAPLTEAMHRVSEETGLGVERLRKYWRTREPRMHGR